MQGVLKVLLAEDEPIDAEIELRELERAGIEVSARVVQAERDYRDALQHFAPDVILSDFSMPGFDGMTALAAARERCPDVPFIFVSGTLGEEHAIRALKSGAVDYVLKHNLIRLPSAVERAVEEARSRAARRAAEAELDSTRERLASIFATLRDVLWSVDRDSGALVYVSPAVEAIYGRPPRDFLREPELRLRMVHPEDAARVGEGWQALRQGGDWDAEYRIVRPDGSVRWIHDRGRWVGSGTGSRLDGVARDVTEQAEQRLRIARLSTIRDVLSAVNSAIVRIRDRKELLEEACRIAVEVGGLQLAMVCLCEGDGLSLAAVQDEGAGGVAAGESAAQPGGAPARALAEEALRAADVVVRNELDAWAGFPLVVDGAAAGVFVLHARESGYFDHEEVRLLKEVSGNIAFALSVLAKQEKLNYLAYYDPLTGLANRALFASLLGEAIDNARRHRHLAAVIVIDIARFKALNDVLGQQGGDRLLQEVGERLKEATGEDGRASRLNADRYALLVHVLRDVGFLPRVMLERVTVALRRPFHIDGRELRISIRAGIAVFPFDGGDGETLFRNAEAALNKARASGERFAFYAPEMNVRFAERLETENRLRTALENHELELFFQPKVDATTRALVSLEGLMRWRDPQGGLSQPASFIPILEDTGLIVEAGWWAMHEAVRRQLRWRRNGLHAARIAVNVSALQLRRADFVDEVRRLLVPLEREHRGLDIEITESVLMENMAEAIDKLNAIRELGVEIAIDDFGTGYSSLAYINRLPIHLLKIDRSFVSGLSRHAESRSIVSTIIALARTLKLKVVAEGVETEEQATLVRQLRCDQIQGYLVARPMPAEEIERRFLPMAVVGRL